MKLILVLKKLDLIIQQIFTVFQKVKNWWKIGWINENSLSELLIDNLKSLKVGDHTGLIKLGNNYLILKIDEIKYNAVK